MLLFTLFVMFIFLVKTFDAKTALCGEEGAIERAAEGATEGATEGTAGEITEMETVWLSSFRVSWDNNNALLVLITSDIVALDDDVELLAYVFTSPLTGAIDVVIDVVEVVDVVVDVVVDFLYTFNQQLMYEWIITSSASNVRCACFSSNAMIDAWWATAVEDEDDDVDDVDDVDGDDDNDEDDDVVEEDDGDEEEEEEEDEVDWLICKDDENVSLLQLPLLSTLPSLILKLHKIMSS